MKIYQRKSIMTINQMFTPHYAIGTELTMIRKSQYLYMIVRIR